MEDFKCSLLKHLLRYCFCKKDLSLTNRSFSTAARSGFQFDSFPNFQTNIEFLDCAQYELLLGYCFCKKICAVRIASSRHFGKLSVALSLEAAFNLVNVEKLVNQYRAAVEIWLLQKGIVAYRIAPSRLSLEAALIWTIL